MTLVFQWWKLYHRVDHVLTPLLLEDLLAKFICLLLFLTLFSSIRLDAKNNEREFDVILNIFWAEI